MSNHLMLIPGGAWSLPRPLLTSDRLESWSYRLLTSRDVTIGPLDGVEGCDLTFNVNSTIRGGGSLTYSGPPVDWMKHRIQVFYRCAAQGQEAEWPLGVFIPSAPETAYADLVEPVELELYDKLYLLDMNKNRNSYSVPAGAIVTDRIRGILSGAGYANAVTDSTETLKSALAWPAGTSYLRIVNDLLAAINYFSVYADGNGIFRCEPYVRPQDRTPSFAFRDDSQGIYSPQFSRLHDTFSVPNRFLAIGTVEGEALPPVAYATDDDPASPYSYESRNIRITEVEENVDATSPAVLQAYVDRRLSELQRSTRTLSISHLPIPVQLNDVVTFTRDRHGISVTAVVQTLEMDSATGSLVRATLREVEA